MHMSTSKISKPFWNPCAQGQILVLLTVISWTSYPTSCLFWKNRIKAEIYSYTCHEKDILEYKMCLISTYYFTSSFKPLDVVLLQGLYETFQLYNCFPGIFPCLFQLYFTFVIAWWHIPSYRYTQMRDVMYQHLVGRQQSANSMVCCLSLFTILWTTSQKSVELFSLDTAIISIFAFFGKLCSRYIAVSSRSP